MNDEIRKRVAARLNISPDQVSDKQLLAAWDQIATQNDRSDLALARKEAQEKLSAHAERGAVSTAVVDAALKEINGADTPALCRALTGKYDSAYSLLEGGAIETSADGDPRPFDGGAAGEVPASQLVADRVASLRKENKGLTPIEAFDRAKSELTAEQRTAYEQETLTMEDWRRGG